MKTDKKKIIFITSRSGYGGGPLHVNILIEGLKNIYDIFCAAPLSEPYGVKWLEQVGSDKFIEIPHRKFQIKYFLQLVSFIKKNQIEILHAHGKGAGLYGRLIKIFYPKIYIIFTFHGFHSGKYNTLTKKFYIILERSLNRLTNQFINVSNGEQDVCIANGIYKKSKSIVIYNALENAPTIKFDKAQLREKLALPKNEFLILSAVRFNEQKNIPETINIASKLDEHLDIFFVVIGDGEQKYKIEQQIEKAHLKNIMFTGYQSNVQEYMLASDTYLSTSLWEGMPYSLIEATRAGLPIVASDVIGNNEVVVNGYNGYLFQSGDIDKAEKNILHIKSSRERQQIFSENSKKLFKDKFELKTMLGKLAKVYSDIN